MAQPDSAPSPPPSAPYRSNGRAFPLSRRRLRAPGEDGLGAAFHAPSRRSSRATGRVIVTGMGKSGHIARKIAATLASTGQPAFFVHAGRGEPRRSRHGAEQRRRAGACHGRARRRNWRRSSPTPSASRIPLIAMTSNADSALGREADVRAAPAQGPEACPNGLAPTDLDDDATRARRRAGDRAAGGQGIHRPRFRRSASRRQARRQARLCARHHARGERMPRIRVGAPDGRRDRRNDRPRASAASACSTIPARWSASSPTATCAGTSLERRSSTRRSRR